MRELHRMTSRQRSRTLPSRVKLHRDVDSNNSPSKPRTRSKTPLPFRKVAEFLRRRRHKTELDPELFSLERQGWFHGKITAEYAERPLRKNGDFLVREDPATPGTYFLVLRHQGSTQVIPIVKGKSSKSSKSSRIKYRIDGLDIAYESIPELVTYYWHERKTVSKKAQILIIRPISRDATLLSVDEKPKPKKLELEKLFTPYNNAPSSDVHNAPDPTPDEIRKRMKRQGSDPVISPRVSKQVDEPFDLQLVETLEQTLKQEKVEKNPVDNSEKETLEQSPEEPTVTSPSSEVAESADKEDENVNNNNNDSEDKASIQPLPGHINSSVHTVDSLKSRSWSNMERSAEATSAPPLARSTSTPDTDTGLYSTPRTPPVQHSNSWSVHSAQSQGVPSDGGYYCSPRSLDSTGTLSRNERATNDTSFQDYAIPSSRPVSGGQELEISSSFSFPKENGKVNLSCIDYPDRKIMNNGMSYSETDMDYAVPSSRPAGDNADEDANTDTLLPQSPEQGGGVYDVPVSLIAESGGTQTVGKSETNVQLKSELKSGHSAERRQSDSKRQQQLQMKPQTGAGETPIPKPPAAVAPKRKEEIYQGVVKKLNQTLVDPFLCYDARTLARHLTRADIQVLWGRDLYNNAQWNLEDGSGGAIGLELLMLPQGRDRRAALLNRYENLKFWVAAVLISAGDVLTRKKVLEKMIDLADSLCGEDMGNLISFMAVMEGLSQPQVTRLHHTWSCLHHHNSPRAISYHSTLKPLVGLLASGAPSPFPGVCLPYLIPVAKYLEMSTEEILEDLVYDDVALGIEAMMGHLDAGRNVMEQLHAYKDEAIRQLGANYVEEAVLTDYFKSKFVVADLLGLGTEGSERSGKISTLLHWLSENVERSGRPSLSSESS